MNPSPLVVEFQTKCYTKIWTIVMKYTDFQIIWRFESMIFKAKANVCFYLFRRWGFQRVNLTRHISIQNLGFQNHFFNPISADAAVSTKAVNKSQTHMSSEMFFKEISILKAKKIEIWILNIGCRCQWVHSQFCLVLVSSNVSVTENGVMKHLKQLENVNFFMKLWIYI